MPFDKTKSKSIQVSNDADNLILEALALIETKFSTKLSGRSTTIDYVFSRWLKDNR